MILTERTKEDALTKSGNRERLYEDVLDKIENNRPFFIVFIDLDRFKSINDNHGHSTGDAYLIDFVDTVKKMFNNSDCLYRLSGDEFVYLFEGNEIESFLEKLENLKFLRNKSGVPFLGLSLGYSSFPVDGNELSGLLHLADVNMYQNKKLKHRNMK